MHVMSSHQIKALHGFVGLIMDQEKKILRDHRIKKDEDIIFVNLMTMMLRPSFNQAFGDRFFFWSFVNEDCRDGRHSSRHSNNYKGSNGRHSSWRSNNYKTSWRWKDQSEDEYDYTPGDDTQKLNLASERTALGLSASGPLKLEELKNAYRASALNWHPDHHQGSSKAHAEEKFKHCISIFVRKFGCKLNSMSPLSAVAIPVKQVGSPGYEQSQYG